MFTAKTHERGAPNLAKEIRYWRAINEALHEEMQRDERVCVIGEDVAAAGGPFGTTRGLLEKFGELRVRDTPISEETIVGCAIGAAMTGLRPVAEIMFFDFIGLAMDQLVNNAAKMYFMSAGRLNVPLTILTLCAVDRNSGPQHTSSLEAWLAHVPGLKVVWPATPYDAKGLIKSAIRDEDPVVVICNLNAWTRSGMVPDAEYLIPIGQADIKREGTDLTLITLGSALQDVLNAAEKLASEGIDAEVVDLRSVSPLDMETLINSVEKTKRAMVIHDAVLDYGIGAEISARLTEHLFGSLQKPVARLGSAFSPTPFSPTLSAGLYPQVDEIVDMARKLLA